MSLSEGFSQKNLGAFASQPSFHLVVLALFTGLVFGQTAGFGLIWLDDFDFLVTQPPLSSWKQAFTGNTFGDKHDVFYRPMLSLLLFAEAKIASGNWAVYHVINVLLHFFSGILLWVLLRKWVCSPVPAFFAAGAFLLHPIQTPAVAWIFGVNDVLLALFSFGSLYALWSFLHGKKWMFALHGLLLFAALLTKESALLLLPGFGLMTLAFFPTLARSGRSVAVMGSWIIVAGLWWWLRSEALSDSEAVPFSHYQNNLFTWLPAVVIKGLGKIFLPLHLSLIPVMEAVPWWPGLLSLAVLTVFVFFSKNRWRIPSVFFAFVCLMIPVAMVSDFFSLEHRHYLPFGLLLIGLSGTELQTQLPERIAFFLGTGLLILLSVYTFERSTYFKNRYTFWEKSLEESPGAIQVYRSLSSIYLIDGRTDKALHLAKKGLQIHPGDPDLAHAASVIYAREGDFERSLFYAEITLKKNAAHFDALFNKGLNLLNLNRVEEGVASLEELVTKQPGYVNALPILAEACLYLGRRDSAKKYVLRMVEVGLRPEKQELKDLLN